VVDNVVGRFREKFNREKFKNGEIKTMNLFAFIANLLWIGMIAGGMRELHKEVQKRILEYWER
jgi:hypothetical protein